MNARILIASVVLVFATIATVTSFTTAIFQYGDSCAYMALAQSFAAGHGFCDPAIPSHPHALWWPPGFPAFLGFAYTIAGNHWQHIALSILIFYYLTVLVFSLYIQKSNGTPTAIAVASALCVSGSIHLLASTLYSEIFFTASTLLFFIVWERWRHTLSFERLVILAVFSVGIASLRNIGIALPIALSVYLLFEAFKTRVPTYFGTTVLALLAVYFCCILTIPQLRVGSFESFFGSSKNVATAKTATPHEPGIFKQPTAVERIGSTLRGYALTLVPQSVLPSAYDLVKMNKPKAAVAAILTLIICIGWYRSRAKWRLAGLYLLLYMIVCFAYGPLYKRLLIPVVPFFMLYAFLGIEQLCLMLLRRTPILAYSFVTIAWCGLLFDNTLRTITNPRKTMPIVFGDSTYAHCFNWVCKNTKPDQVVVSQIYSYLYLQRGGLSSPFLAADSPEEIISFLDYFDVKFLMISPFYYRPYESYMNTVHEAIKRYPERFTVAYGKVSEGSYVLEYRF